MSVEIKITQDNTEAVLDELKNKVDIALEMIGQQAENYAKLKCPVDTGLLRNSITHARSGKSISKTYHASKGSNRNKKGNRVSASSKNAGSVKMGIVSGAEGSESDNAVYVGTNVDYAPYIEMGTSTTEPQPFIKPAVMDHVRQYKSIIESVLKR